MLANFVDIVLLWLFLAATVAMAVLAVRARRIEREEGLPASKYRVLAAVSICGVAALLVVFGTLAIVRPAAPVEPAAKPVVDKDVDPEVAKLEAEYKELRAKLT